MHIYMPSLQFLGDRATFNGNENGNCECQWFLYLQDWNIPGHFGGPQVKIGHIINRVGPFKVTLQCH